MSEKLILASASRSRAEILRNAGLDIVQLPAHLDEETLRIAMQAEGCDPAEQSMRLAELKAVNISRDHSGLVVGADQMLVCSGEIFSKPGNIAEARGQLQALRGGTHSLFTALCVCEDGVVLWKYLACPELTMREVPDDLIDAYLELEGEQALSSPGACRIEGPSIQFFSRIDGDYFSILGLPLLPFLSWLRDRGVLR